MRSTKLESFHSQKHQTWKTPSEIYSELDSEFHFDFDPCPPDPTFDGLAVCWEGRRVYCNPPYNNIAPWLAKAKEADVAVFLLPSRTGTEWFATYAPQAEVRFIRGRINFRGHKASGNYEWSVLLIFRKEKI